MTIPRGAADLFAKHTGGKVPIAVTFQVTDRCNYRCVHCYQEHTDRDELSFAEIERILREIADMGVLFLTLMGGEFFMRRDADDILRLAHELDFAIKVLSTGHHIHERRADLIAKLRPIEVNFSMYAADPGIHDGVTRQKGSWKRTYAAARRLVERGVPIKLKAPAMETNAHDLGEFRKLAEALGSEYSSDPKITATEGGEQDPVSLRMSWKTLRGFYRDSTSGVADDLRQAYASGTRSTPPLETTSCSAGQRVLSISPQGEVWPCNSLPLPVGDLRTKSLREIWFGSEELADIQTLQWAHISECNACELRRYCSRCHAMALLEQGEMRGPSLEACRHAVAVRDALREQGLVPDSEVALPPTWERVDPDGQHARPKQPDRGVRPAGLRVLP